ncbi:uncharacterized protein TRIVIDRAFT_222965 [Trichoderma virens Gv29-8]|uniref:Uncharacterized protein n=1 Tax=Hypocrea virens (strain Gv29-8 / FGSC 10586) TaxID=413071 RepID=G9MVM2_HYPVG|nr:uncharacterized protein TRIVIDRAFT_222965 [Trichoderma virens Gv29-8]EHK21520.1 hypothetical protein TRIVIDRAFT_222965 [Trichoderma virens Gv29-8]
MSSSSSTSASSTNSSSSQGSSKSKWDTEYIDIPREKGLPLRFIAYAAGASLPTTMKKMTRKEKKGGEGASRWDFLGRDTQLFWVVQPEDRQRRGRSRNPRERNRQKSTSTASSPASSPEINVAPGQFGEPAGYFPHPTASGAAGVPMVPPGHGPPRGSGFSFGFPPGTNFPGGPLPPFGRN